MKKFIPFFDYTPLSLIKELFFFYFLKFVYYIKMFLRGMKKYSWKPKKISTSLHLPCKRDRRGRMSISTNLKFFGTVNKKCDAIKTREVVKRRKLSCSAPKHSISKNILTSLIFRSPTLHPRLSSELNNV